MNSIASLYYRGVSLLSGLSWFPPLLARITIGVIFAESGWGKLNNLPKVVEYFQSLNIPSPEIQAPFAAGTELVAGVLVLFGLATRIASIPLIVIMLVAIETAKKSEINELSDLFALSEYLYIVLLIYLIVHGAGMISADKIVSQMFGRK